MTKTQAVTLYLKTHKTAAEMVRRLMLWNPKLSMRDNAKRLKIDPALIRDFAKDHGLRYVAVGNGNNYGGVNRSTNTRST